MNPPDLLRFRAGVRTRTGLPSVDVGIEGDGRHDRTGGYHEGRGVLVFLGRFHPPPGAHVGSSNEDYSARQRRDREGLDEYASAVDIGDGWASAAGGRTAWIRYNQLVYAEMVDHPSRLSALRAINVSVDGRRKQRYDQVHRKDGLIPSKDTVTTHTHHEFWRDTEGDPIRAATLARLLKLIDQAIRETTEGGTMTLDGVQALQLHNAEHIVAGIRDMEDPIPNLNNGTALVAVPNKLAQRVDMILSDVGPLQGQIAALQGQIAALQEDLNTLKSTPPVQVDPPGLIAALSANPAALDALTDALGQAIGDTLWQHVEDVIVQAAARKPPQN